MIDNNQNTFDFLGLLTNIRKHIWLILVFGIIGLVTSLLISIIFITPKYNSTIDLLVSQKTDDSAAQFNVQQADLQAINTYKDVLKKPIVLNAVLKEAREKSNYLGTESDLSSAIKIDNQANSKIISVTVTDTNPYRAADIVNSIGRVFTKKIKKIMKVNNVAIVTKGSVNSRQVSPNKKLNSFFGLFLGLVIGCMFVIVRHLSDKTVKDSEFLSNGLGIVNLGQIYHIDKEKSSFKDVEIINHNNLKSPDSISSRRRV